ncbi:MAG: type II secretion system protein GspJ [Bdellovibrionales bacterium]
MNRAQKEKNKNKQNPTQTQSPAAGEGATDPASGAAEGGTPQEATTDAATIDPALAEKYKTKPLRTDSSFFIGEKEEVHFTSTNNVQLNPDQPVSQLAEISYFVRTCKGRLDKKQSSKCLFRRVSPYVDDDPKEGGNATVLLENIDTFELRYYNIENDEWRATWDSKLNQDPAIRGHFPGAVEVKIIVTNPEEKDGKDNAKEYGYNLVAAVHFPNNPQSKTANTASNTTSPGGTGAVSSPTTGDSE